jgi:hypothetical protein
MFDIFKHPGLTHFCIFQKRATLLHSNHFFGRTSEIRAHENFGRISSVLGEIRSMLSQVSPDLGELHSNQQKFARYFWGWNLTARFRPFQAKKTNMSSDLDEISRKYAKVGDALSHLKRPEKANWPHSLFKILNLQLFWA